MADCMRTTFSLYTHVDIWTGKLKTLLAMLVVRASIKTNGTAPDPNSVRPRRIQHTLHVRGEWTLPESDQWIGPTMSTSISSLVLVLTLVLCQLIDWSSQANILDNEYLNPVALSPKQKNLIQLLKSIVNDETNGDSPNPYNLYSADNQPDQRNLPDLSRLLLNNQLDYNQAGDYESPNADDYYPANVDDGFYYAVDGQDGWFDGPVLPKVESLETKPANELDEAEKKKLYDDMTDQIEKLLQKDILSMIGNGGMDKRRQKIVIKDSKRDLQTSSTTTTTTTSAPISEELKSKLLHKSKMVHRGQKEVPMLRPAEAKQKDEWPSELEETSLSEVSVVISNQVRGHTSCWLSGGEDSATLSV